MSIKTPSWIYEKFTNSSWNSNTCTNSLFLHPYVIANGLFLNILFQKKKKEKEKNQICHIEQKIYLTMHSVCMHSTLPSTAVPILFPFRGLTFLTSLNHYWHSRWHTATSSWWLTQEWPRKMEDSLEERQSIDVSQGIKNPHRVSHYYEVWNFHESEIVTLSANGPTFLLEFSLSLSAPSNSALGHK